MEGGREERRGESGGTPVTMGGDPQRPSEERPGVGDGRWNGSWPSQALAIKILFPYKHSLLMSDMEPVSFQLIASMIFSTDGSGSRDQPTTEGGGGKRPCPRRKRPFPTNQHK